VLIERASTVISGDEIRARLADALQEHLHTQRLDVTLDNHAFVLNLPADQPPNIEVQNVSYDAILGCFTAVLIAAAGGPEPVRVPVSGRVREVVAVPVLKRQIMPGDVISASDIDWADLRVDASVADVLRDASELVGHTPRRGLPPGAPIRARDVQAPILVAKGALVRIVLQTPVMLLTAQGRALDNGARSETIRVMNIQSNRPIEAVVAGPNLVNVVTATHVALSAETHVQ
jgi:flagella basal body P-ring formation protein FlgA